MSGVFLDTMGLVAVANGDDQWHARARQVWDEIVKSRHGLIATSLVLIELGDGLSRVGLRQLALRIRESLLQSDRVEIIQT